MPQNKKILLATDFTEDAEKAFSYALEICKKKNADLHLFHVIEEPYDFAVRIEEMVQKKKNIALKKLENMMEQARDSEAYSNLAVYSAISRGKPHYQILDKADELNAELIIVGTRGESSLKRIIYGNVTSSIILESPIPVLTVPVNSKKPYLDRFIFATDIREDDLPSLKNLVSFARSFNADIHVLHVNENGASPAGHQPYEEFCARVKDTISYDNIRFEEVHAKIFSKGVSKYIEENPVSLLAITRYKKAFLQTILWASTTQELSYHTTVPMLVKPPPTNE